MGQSKFIYLGIKGSVIAVDAADGREVWAQKLKGSDFVNVVLDGNDLFATTHGEVFCLAPRTGKLRWHNPLKGYGWGLVSIAGAGVSENTLLLLAEKRRQEEDSATATSNSAAAS
jgi:outer membrane protein assembly factor BamB